MIRKGLFIFCENEHGTGDVCFPDVNSLDGFELQQIIIQDHTVSAVRAFAKKVGWGRINGGDYCPACMESLSQ